MSDRRRLPVADYTVEWGWVENHDHRYPYREQVRASDARRATSLVMRQILTEYAATPKDIVILNVCRGSA